jgi:hypothetical protein
MIGGTMALHMLTTVDNPYDPFTQWDEWNQWDQASGYFTTAFLARVVNTSNDLSEADQDQAIEDAIDQVVDENVNGMYRKVAEPTT